MWFQCSIFWKLLICAPPAVGPSLTSSPGNPGGSLFPGRPSGPCKPTGGPPPSGIHTFKTSVCMVIFSNQHSVKAFLCPELQSLVFKWSGFSPPLLAPLSVQALLSAPQVQKSPLDQDYLVFLRLLQIPEEKKDITN